MKAEKHTQMIAAPANTTQMTEKKVKVLAMAPLHYKDQNYSEGQTIEMTAEEAEGYVREYKNLSYSFSGERQDYEAPRHTVIRAKIVE